MSSICLLDDDSPRSVACCKVNVLNLHDSVPRYMNVLNDMSYNVNHDSHQEGGTDLFTLTFMEYLISGYNIISIHKKRKLSIYIGPENFYDLEKHMQIYFSMRWWQVRVQFWWVWNKGRVYENTVLLFTQSSLDC